MNPLFALVGSEDWRKKNLIFHSSFFIFHSSLNFAKQNSVGRAASRVRAPEVRFALASGYPLHHALRAWFRSYPSRLDASWRNFFDTKQEKTDKLTYLCGWHSFERLLKVVRANIQLHISGQFTKQ